MSTLENTVLEEKLYEEYGMALCVDNELQNALAYYTLDSLDYYLFCKEDAWDKVDWDAIWEKVLVEFYNCEGTCFNIRALCHKAYPTLKIDDEV